MDGILRKVYYLPETYIFLAIAAISLIISIICLKTWFDNRVKNEKSLKMIQTLQTDNEKLTERIHTI